MIRPSIRSRGSYVMCVDPVAMNTESSGPMSASESTSKSVRNEPDSFPTKSRPCTPRATCRTSCVRIHSRPPSLCVAATRAPMIPAPISIIVIALSNTTSRRRPMA